MREDFKSGEKLQRLIKKTCVGIILTVSLIRFKNYDLKFISSKTLIPDEWFEFN